MLAHSPDKRIKVEDIQYYLVEEKPRKWNIADLKGNSEYSTASDDDDDSVLLKEGMISSI